MIIFRSFSCHYFITVWAWYCCFYAWPLRCFTANSFGVVLGDTTTVACSTNVSFASRLGADLALVFVSALITSSICGSECSVCIASPSNLMVIILGFFDVLLDAFLLLLGFCVSSVWVSISGSSISSTSSFDTIWFVSCILSCNFRKNKNIEL